MGKKRSLTLLEVMIAFSLLSIVLFFVLSPFKELALLSGRMGTASTSVMKNHRIRGKLMRLFSQAEDEFSCENGTIQCKTSIGTDPDPDFSSPVTIKLFKNKESQLVLTLTAPSTEKSRQQVLADDVEQLEWTFYKLVDGKYISSNRWEETSLPECIKLTLNGTDLPITLAKKTEGVQL